ncbi:MAG TPA: HD domain-containing protein [Candidatus Bilamarchaeum sp.]|nr:HD domain-containing protein [Candidatus Bilamarchaeum sp.]
MTIPQEYAHHARAKLGETLLYRLASKYQPAYEGLVTMHIARRMIAQEKLVRDRGMRALVAAARERLEETDGALEKWSYTRRHSLEVAYFSYIIANEALMLGVRGSERITPEMSFAGGFAHDIGKSLLPMPLIVKELGVKLAYLCLWEGRPLNSVEKRVLRDYHISAGTRFVRLYSGQENTGILDMVGLHHVMYNGRGSMYPSYPANLKGSDLQLPSRIAKTADFISAVLPRHYRKEEWVHSMQDSLGYAIAVAGVELDPTTLKCFMVGTHDIEPEEADALIGRLMYPGSVSDVADFQAMKAYVKETVEQDAEFRAVMARRAVDKIDKYRARIGKCAAALDAPTLEELPQ